jgi:hypothetical protein
VKQLKEWKNLLKNLKQKKRQKKPQRRLKIMKTSDIITIAFERFAEEYQGTYKRLPDKNLMSLAQNWLEDLATNNVEVFRVAVRNCIATNETGFAPSLGKINAKIREICPQPSTLMTEAEAWQMVMNVCRCGFSPPYQAGQAFDKLPEAVQRAVGSANHLLYLGNDCFGDSLSVEHSQFLRSYREIVEDARKVEAMPPDVQRLAIANRQAMRPAAPTVQKTPQLAPMELLMAELGMTISR